MRSGHVDAVSRKFVAGWAADRGRPDAALILSIWVDGVRRGMTKANRLRTDLAAAAHWGSGHHGFRFSFGEALSAEQDHVIAVRFEDGTLLPNGEQVLAREGSAPAPAEQPPSLRPILVAAPPRTGRSLLMRLLAGSPEIIVAGQPPYETGLLATCAEKLLALGAALFNEEAGRAWRGGKIPLSFTSSWVQDHTARSAAALAREYYRLLAADLFRPEAKYFVEIGALDPSRRDFARRAFPDLLELLLIRDPRDMLCSHVVWSGTDPDDGFARLTQDLRLIQAIAHQRPGPLVLRYEDMLRDEAGMLRALSDVVGSRITQPEQETRATLFRLLATSASAEGSIERWREDLPARLVARCADSWGDFLRAFRYDVG
jgi:hypothetical protein